MDPRGKAAVVTGGASGLGAATVRRLLDEGARVAVIDLQPSSEPGVLGISCDITDPTAAAGAIARIGDAFGDIHILANCAGIGGIGAIATPDEPGDVVEFRRVIDVNLMGA